MAQQTKVIVTSDLSGEELENPIHLNFSFDNNDYQIDLSHDEASEFDRLLKPYRDAATKVDNRRQRATRSTSKPNDDRKEYIRKVREWAKSQNLEVSDRGRISAEVEAAYKSAHRNQD